MEKVDLKELILSMRFLFGIETAYPREEAFDMIVLKALYGAEETQPLNVQTVQHRLKQLGSLTTFFREDFIQESLDRLLDKGKINQKVEDEEKVYFLSDSTINEVEKDIREVRSIFTKNYDRIRSRIKAKYSFLTPPQEIEIGELFKEFVSRIFSKFGDQCARWITGNFSIAHFLVPQETSRILSEILRNSEIKENDLKEAIREEFCTFFTEADPASDTLKFHLAQNYYILKLLGLDPQTQYLTRQAFADSALYLDSNVIINAILTEARPYRTFMEVKKLSAVLDIKLLVTPITIDEINKVTEYQKELAQKHFDDVPVTIEEKVAANFLKIYLKRKKLNSDYKVEELFEPFDNLRETVGQTLALEIEDDLIFDQLLKHKDEMEKVKAKVKEVALEKRNKIKGPVSAEHDAFYVLLIRERRVKKPKTWFLTLDTTLPYVSEAFLGAMSVPFCFTLDTWLQCISPFASTDTEIQDFSKVFSNLFSSYLLPAKQLFSLDDFQVLFDLELSIRSLQKDALEKILRHIRNEILKGQLYDRKNIAKIAYQLRKFLVRLTKEYDQSTALKGTVVEKENTIQILEDKVQQLVTWKENKEREEEEKRNTTEAKKKRILKWGIATVVTLVLLFSDYVFYRLQPIVWFSYGERLFSLSISLALLGFIIPLGLRKWLWFLGILTAISIANSIADILSPILGFF